MIDLYPKDKAIEEVLSPISCPDCGSEDIKPGLSELPATPVFCNKCKTVFYIKGGI
jgi:ribosomal protein S27E